MNTGSILKACEIAGGQAALARLVDVHPSMVHQWIKGYKRVPAERCPAIERATDRAVTCEEIRPDVDWAYLRNTQAEIQGAA